MSAYILVANNEKKSLIPSAIITNLNNVQSAPKAYLYQYKHILPTNILTQLFVGNAMNFIYKNFCFILTTLPVTLTFNNDTNKIAGY